MLLATDERKFPGVADPNAELGECTPVDVDPDHGMSGREP